MDVKEILLNSMAEDKFWDICNFVEELYLMESDLLILMARKFFNLFCVFHEINCEKYERLEIPYENGKKIVTNRALPLLKNDLKKGRFQKVVIADDIIIHGRSIREVYDEVVKLCPKAEVSLMSYIRNDQEKFVYEEIIDKIHSRYQAESYDEWRELSDEIVNVFYMSGRPYISYLPYFSLKIGWQDLKEKLQQGECLPIQDEDMERYGVEACMYTGKELDVFQQLKYCKISVVRFYHYSMLDKVIAVPYFCMDVMKKDSVRIISDIVRKQYLTQEYQELVSQNGGASEMRMMELEYTLSAWLCMHVFGVLDIQVDTWHKQIEQYNFCEKLLPDAILSVREIQCRLDAIETIGKQICPQETELNADIEILLEKYYNLKEVYNKKFVEWCKMHSWTGKRTDYKQRFMDNYLILNGTLDEERCKKRDIEQKRLFGIPISFLLDDMGDFLYKLYGHGKSKNSYVKQVFAVILRAIDSGRGTVVTKVVGGGTETGYMESVIYAGEQNYKFYESTNFPVMYGLYLIEQESAQQNVPEEINDARKKKMIDKFSQYLVQQNIFYIKEEMQQIAECNISENYKKFLQNSYEKYYGNPVLNEAITMALDICSNAGR